MQILENTPQGSASWHAARAAHLCASEAAAAMGVSKYTTRGDLLKLKATGIAEEVTPAKQRLFDAGHASEASTRDIAEKIAGVEFFPVVGTAEVEGLKLLASFDGLDMLDEIAWENKLLSRSLVAQIEAGGLEPHYWAQLEHQLLVSGALQVLFTASDGTAEGTHHLWYTSRPERRAQLIAAWKQFDVDLAAYVPAQIKERPPADVVAALPALVIHAKGEITTSNMKEYGAALAERLAHVRSIALVTDLDFSNAKAGAALLRGEILKAKTVKAAMLQQTMTVGEAASMIDTWCEDMRLTALQLEKDVEREDLAKKSAMVLKAKADYEAHIDALKIETGGPWIVLQAPNWPEALKSKRNYASMQDALDTMLANAKIASTESARKICAALSALDEEAKGYEHLFADRLSFISKPAEDVRALVKGRIAERLAAEAKTKAEAEAATQLRIKEAADAAAAKATADAAALAQKQAADAAEEARADERRRVEQRDADLRSHDPAVGRAAQATMKHPNGAPMYGESIKETGDFILLTDDGKRSVFCDMNDDPEPDAQPIRTGGGIARHAATPAPAPAVLQMPVRAAAPAAAPLSKPTLRLGVINERLEACGVYTDAARLKALGFEPAEKDRSALLFHERDWAHILAAMANNIQALQAKEAA